jgi:hypothetical protein
MGGRLGGVDVHGQAGVCGQLHRLGRQLSDEVAQAAVAGAWPASVPRMATRSLAVRFQSPAHVLALLASCAATQQAAAPVTEDAPRRH